jgi:hypothetical protein
MAGKSLFGGDEKEAKKQRKLHTIVCIADLFLADVCQSAKISKPGLQAENVALKSTGSFE